MKLIDMKMSNEEKAEYNQAPTALSDDCQYPYGLRITLNDEALSKLFPGIPEVGSEMMLACKVSVCSFQSYAGQDGEPEKSMQLQIMAMGVSEAPKKDAAKALYGDKES